jgi:hypothetical protein
MSDNRTAVEAPLGFLLLRDGHAVPLTGLSPDEIKAGVKHRVPNPDADPVKHRQTLNAVVDRLGFAGDFGDYKHKGWPAFEAFLQDHGCTHRPRYAIGEEPGSRPSTTPEGCTHRTGLFPSDHGGCIDLSLVPHSGPTRRQLADRIFESGLPFVQRVFLGHGVAWKTWDGGDGHHPPEAAVRTIGEDPQTAQAQADALFEDRLEFFHQWGFLDDKLIAGPVKQIVDKAYWPEGSTADQQHQSHAKLTRAVRAFREIFEASPEGWVDVLRYNDRLVVLRGHDGAWDVLWRSYRAEEPPKPSDLSRWTKLSVEDIPTSLMSESDLARAVHFRQEAWEEHEAHAAEQAFYDRGGTPQERRFTSEADVRVAWLREQGRVPKDARLPWDGELPSGFHKVVVDGRRLAVSELVTVGEFRRMLVETGYLDRRILDNHPWEPANDGVPDHQPVGGSWSDAQAFCAWKERQLGVAVRLLRRTELRTLRPFHSDHYGFLSQRDFPWENYPPRPIAQPADAGNMPRRDVPSAVSWSEPRFLEPRPDQPEFPPPTGWGGKSRKRWITDFPPRAAWRQPLPWSTYQKLRFIDAWDAYEWCHETGFVSGRFWEGPLGGWGAYKNAKVTFRVVLDLGE